MPILALMAKNSTSGPISSVSLRMGLSFCFSDIVSFIFAALRGFVSRVCSAPLRAALRPGTRTPSLQPHYRPGEIARGEWCQVVDTLADADEVHRQFEAVGDGDEDAAARGAVELGHDEPGDAGGLA